LFSSAASTGRREARQTLYFTELQRPNGFHGLRLLAALLVMVDHAFPLTGRPSLAVYSETLGGIAVSTFFVISGFLVAESRVRSNSVVSFLKKRVLRIFPGFTFVVLVCVFLLGPALTTFPLSDYFRHELTVGYFNNLTLLEYRPSLPGVFDDNPLQYAVNGSTWTLPLETAMYVLLAVAGPLWTNRWGALLALGAAFGAWVSFGNAWPSTEIFFWSTLPARLTLKCGLFFGAGVAASMWRSQLKLTPSFAVVLWGMTGITASTGVATVFWVLSLSYSVLLLAAWPTSPLNRLANGPDYSYGVYLFAFPVQQTLVSFGAARLPVALNLAICAVLTFACAMVSWHLVERPALRLKASHRASGTLDA
jgi:peptidoglycan/LPS O-acetylase OafA/YrhL